MTREAPGQGLKHLTLRPSLYQTKPENELKKLTKEATTRKRSNSRFSLVQTKKFKNSNMEPNKRGAKGSFR
jgi:hypothetical protein